MTLGHGGAVEKVVVAHYTDTHRAIRNPTFLECIRGAVGLWQFPVMPWDARAVIEQRYRLMASPMVGSYIRRPVSCSYWIVDDFRSEQRTSRPKESRKQ
jgi:hypothetical protein